MSDTIESAEDFALLLRARAFDSGWLIVEKATALIKARDRAKFEAGRELAFEEARQCVECGHMYYIAAKAKEPTPKREG